MVGITQRVRAGEDGRRFDGGDEPGGFAAIGNAGEGMKRAILLCAAMSVAAIAVVGQTPSGKDVVSPSAYASYDPVARGENLQVAVVMKIKPGFHVNAREVTEDYLIKTDLKTADAQGFKAGEVSYPKGSLQKFTFSKDKALNVYTDSVTLRVPITVA